MNIIFDVHCVHQLTQGNTMGHWHRKYNVKIVLLQVRLDYICSYIIYLKGLLLPMGKHCLWDIFESAPYIEIFHTRFKLYKHVAFFFHSWRKMGLEKYVLKSFAYLSCTYEIPLGKLINCEMPSTSYWLFASCWKPLAI